MTIDIATIERRGDVGGFVSSIPPEDQFVQWRSERDVDVMTFLASLAGERLFFDGDNSAGVGGDMRGAHLDRRDDGRVLGDGSVDRLVLGEPRRDERRPAGGRRHRPRDARRRVRSAGRGQAPDVARRNRTILEAHRDDVLAVAHALEAHKTITGDDVAAIIDGIRGSLLDGRPYHEPAFRTQLEAYHAAVLAAHRTHAEVEGSIPVPLPPFPPSSPPAAPPRSAPAMGPGYPDRLMRLYNSLTRALEEVIPVEPGHVAMYTCGPTVYRHAHLGNLRTFMLADLIRRALEFEGLRVTQVMNITDVGHMTDESSPEAIDKMLLAMEDEGLSPLEIAEKYAAAVFADAAALGIRPADRYPRATEHVGEMISLTETLVERGHAYVVDSGSVYYDVTSFPGYGALSGNTLDNLREGHRDLETDSRKRNPADFALWKSAGPGRLMKWDSPWGEGFPGWHVECSAMSMKYLGERFDVHTGGTDLRFPHHEDEIAQSEGAVGHRVVSIWVHGGHLRLAGQKIAKSTGNVVRVQELEERGLDPLSFRWLTFQTRYRSEMDFAWDSMEDADRRVKQLRRHMADWVPAADALGTAARALDARFHEAVASDLDLPTAVVIVNELDHSADVSPGEKYALLATWDKVLGLDLVREAHSSWAISPDMKRLMTERDAARAEKDYATSDRIRDELASMGVEVMDTAEGTKVRPRD